MRRTPRYQRNTNTSVNFDTRVVEKVVEKVVDKFIERSDVGFGKYGRTLHDERTQGLKDLVGYLNDIQEELMDAVLYIQAARDELQDLSEESLIQKFNDDEYEERISQE